MRAALRWCAARAPKALHVCAIVGGWASLTAGVAVLTTPAAWWLSVGLFLLSVAGWGHLRVLASVGVYALLRQSEKR